MNFKLIVLFYLGNLPWALILQPFGVTAQVIGLTVQIISLALGIIYRKKIWAENA